MGFHRESAPIPGNTVVFDGCLLQLHSYSTCANRSGETHVPPSLVGIIRRGCRKMWLLQRAAAVKRGCRNGGMSPLPLGRSGNPVSKRSLSAGAPVTPR